MVAYKRMVEVDEHNEQAWPFISASVTQRKEGRYQHNKNRLDLTWRATANATINNTRSVLEASVV